MTTSKSLTAAIAAAALVGVIGLAYAQTSTDSSTPQAQEANRAAALGANAQTNIGKTQDTSTVATPDATAGTGPGMAPSAMPATTPTTTPTAMPAAMPATAPAMTPAVTPITTPNAAPMGSDTRSVSPNSSVSSPNQGVGGTVSNGMNGANTNGDPSANMTERAARTDRN